MTTIEDVEDVDVIDEQIIVHPTAVKKNGRWYVEFRVSADVNINGKPYEFERVMRVPVKKRP